MPPPLPRPDTAAVQGRLSELLGHLDASPLEGSTLFVTGGTGFFGYWMMSLLDLLQRQGCSFQVRVLSRDPERYRRQCPFFAQAAWLELLAGDVKTFRDPRPADLLIHAATDTHAHAHQHPLRILDDVLLGTRNTLEQACAQGVTRGLIVSSGAVYGPRSAPVDEQAPIRLDPQRRADPYGEGKRLAELWSQHLGDSHGMALPVARCFAFVGAGLPLDGHFAIGNFIRDALQGQGIHVQGDGSPVRSYLYGADLAIWLLQILLHGTHARAYNVGSDQAVTINELAHEVARQLSPWGPVTLAKQPVDNPQRSYYVPTIDRARTELGLQPWTDLPQAIRLSASHLIAPP